MRRIRSQNEELVRYINLKLAALGQPISRSTADPDFLEIARPLLRNYHQKDQLLGDRLCPADARIQAFLDAYLSDVCPNGAARLPADTFVLDRAGLARVMSLPPTSDSFLVAVSAVLPRAAGSSAQSAAATAAPRRESSTSPKAACRFRPIRSRFPSRLSRRCGPRRCARRQSC